MKGEVRARRSDGGGGLGSEGEDMKKGEWEV